MLIINLKKFEKDKNKGRFFKKQIRPDPFTRQSMTICGKSCTYLEFNSSAINSLNLERLFKTFDRQIIGPHHALKAIVPQEYWFDYKQYYKRALLSSLINSLGNEICNYSAVVNDMDFEYSAEYFTFAKAVKFLTLNTKATLQTDMFCNRCFVEYGNFVKVTDVQITDDDIVIDFGNMENDGKLLFKKQGKSQILYPDPTYFFTNNELLPLVELGIDTRILCAAFETKSEF